MTDRQLPALPGTAKSSSSPLYTQRAAPDVAAIAKAARGPEGVSSFVSRAFDISDPADGQKTLLWYLKAFLNPATGIWNVQQVEDDGAIIFEDPQKLYLHSPYIFDALHYCAEWEKDMRRRYPDCHPPEEEDEPHVRQVCDQGDIVYDQEGVPVPAANGQVYGGGMLNREAYRRVKKTKGVEFKPVDHTALLTAAATDVQSSLSALAQQGLDNANPGSKALVISDDKREYYQRITEALNEAEHFLTNIFDQCVRGVNARVITTSNFDLTRDIENYEKDKNFTYHNNWSLKNADLSYLNKSVVRYNIGSVRPWEHGYGQRNLQGSQFTPNHFTGDDITGQYPVIVKVERKILWMNTKRQFEIKPDSSVQNATTEEKIKDEISALGESFASLSDADETSGVKTLLDAFSHAVHAHIWLESAACLHELASLDQFKDDREIWDVGRQTLDYGCILAGMSEADRALLTTALVKSEEAVLQQAAIEKKEYYGEDSHFPRITHFKGKMEAQLKQIRKMVGMDNAPTELLP